MNATTIILGDCITAMADLPANSVDAIVTDPPYGLGFMGKAWDELPPGPEWAAAALRVLKPGGHLLAFGGTRTWHRLAVAVEDAGFTIRDSIAWLSSKTFPKSLDVSKAIDKAAGATREVVGTTRKGMAPGRSTLVGNYAPRDPADVTAPATEDAARWQGWGTALKPVFEPILVARKPLVGTVAANVLEYGTGGLNIDACRIGTADGFGGGAKASSGFASGYGQGDGFTASTVGRWPANVILDESQAAVLDAQSGQQRDGVAGPRSRGFRREYVGGEPSEPAGLPPAGYGGEGGASRFFYVATAPKRERPVVDGVAHPTVKPLTLMRYLVRLVTPPGGVVLDPFLGSGTTAEAALLEGFECIGIERAAEYLPLIHARLAPYDGTEEVAA